MELLHLFDKVIQSSKCARDYLLDSPTTEQVVQAQSYLVICVAENSNSHTKKIGDGAL